MAEATLRVGDTVCIITCTKESADFYRDALAEIAEVAAKYADTPTRSDAIVNAIATVVSSIPKDVQP
jgi:hypothetical protein